jgi:protein involved in polysaccharide export with SLBB domain
MPIYQLSKKNSFFACALIWGTLLQPRAALPQDGQLRPGDRLRITVLSDDKNLSGEFEVAPDSTLRHPLYNQVKVAGVPVSMLKEQITSFLRRYQKDPQLDVEPFYKVSVGGEVRTPNVYLLAPQTTIAEAVVRAGGQTSEGNPDFVTVTRDGRRLSFKLSETSALQPAPTIQSGDQISVEARRSTLNRISGITPVLGVAASVLSAIVILSRH